jgi:hypothetical protein
MVLALTVTVVLNGMIVPSFAPAQLAAGRVVAPLQTILTDLAGSVSYEPGAPTLSLVRDGRRIVAAVVFVHDGTPYALLGPIVRDLGGSVQFDARTKTLAIELPADHTLQTPAPFDPSAPHVSPTALFTPEPPRPTPRAVATGVPQPRRTAIPAVPSMPYNPPEESPASHS